MADAVLLRKLDALRRCVDRVRDKTPASEDALRNDPDLQDILAVNLERAIQQCVDIAAHVLAESGAPAPTSMAESFEQLAERGMIAPSTALRMRKAVGFRNVAVHAYEAIDWSIVYAIVTERLDDFTSFAREVMNARST